MRIFLALFGSLLFSVTASCQTMQNCCLKEEPALQTNPSDLQHQFVQLAGVPTSAFVHDISGANLSTVELSVGSIVRTQGPFAFPRDPELGDRWSLRTWFRHANFVQRSQLKQHGLGDKNPTDSRHR
jgi:hypothetical protein